ncbi:prion-like-(Q/N-rich) domain-bearing protein 25 isoform X1 [Camponotus floridanus]|uniref:prion-like-(Q/N-rich) domain-bearing protein 25 isoform X1 n=2 Tax=Camponotus floridanus TaxID=104421 RepID=UPI00059BE459|nr:prion-like-(Q/N-rich) domain-bearing protein 25 isoform X1 [Camponotus floridanus]
MTTLVRISLVLCALVGYSRCQQTVEHAMNVHIGDNCERDAECIKNAFCRWQQNCLCNPYYSPSPDKSLCIATVGLSCEDHTTCQTMANGECRQGTCSCKDEFFLDSTNSSNCIPRPIKIGDRCQIMTICQESFDFASCINEQCQCYTGYHFVNETRACVPNQSLYTFCNSDYECYEDDKSPDILECKNGQCVCKEGEPLCAKGSLFMATGTIVTISLLIQRMAQ